METRALVNVVCPLFITTAISMVQVHGSSQVSKEVDQWLHRLHHTEQKVSRLHFYFHDIVTSSNPTVIRVAQSNTTDKSPTFFGMVNMMDDPLTEGPDPNSRPVGRAQGFYGTCGIKELSLVQAMNLVFTSGAFNGSTLTVVGWNQVLQPLHEMPIVGKTAIFRLARGFAIAKTCHFNVTTGDAVVEYNVVTIQC